MLDKNKLFNFVILNYIILNVFMNQCKCLWTNGQNLANNESSVSQKPMIHKSDHYILSIINKLDNYSNYLEQQNKKARSGIISVVHNELDVNQNVNQNVIQNDNKKNRIHSYSILKNDLREQLNQLKHQNENMNKKFENQHYIYLEQPSNSLNVKYEEDKRNHRLKNNLIYKPIIAEDRRCSENKSNIGIQNIGKKSVGDLKFENEMSAGHNFKDAVNNSYGINRNDNINSIVIDKKTNSSESHQTEYQNPHEHRSTDTIDYKTAINLGGKEEVLDDDYYFMTRQPEYISNQLKPTSLSKLNQLIYQHYKQQQNKQPNLLLTSHQTPVFEKLNLLNKYLNFKLSTGANHIGGDNIGKKLDKQLNKRLDLDDSFSEADELMNEEENSNRIDEQENLVENQEQSNQNKLNSANSIEELNNSDYEFEFSKELDKNYDELFVEDKNSNEIYNQIRSQINNHNYNQNVDKIITQYLTGHKKQLQQKKIDNFKRFKNYYLQYLTNYPTTTNRYIPLHNLKYTSPNTNDNLRKTRSQSKFKNQLNFDDNLNRRSSPATANQIAFLNNQNNNYPSNLYFKKQKAKLDDNYRRLIWLRKQTILNSILNSVHKNGLHYNKIVNHELQPDSSDDLYSYLPMNEYGYDYESDGDLTSTPQSQYVSSVANLPSMMGYYTNAYRYYDQPYTMPNYNMMPAMRGNPYSNMDPYRYNNVPSPSSYARYPQDDSHRAHTEHHHEHYSHTPIHMPPPTYHPPAPQTFSHIIRNNYKKDDLKEMIWPLLFAVVLPLTFGALLLPLTLMFLVNLFMLLQILRNPNDFNNPNDSNNGVAGKIEKYKSGILNLSPRTEQTNSTTAIATNKSQRRSKRTIAYVHTPKLKSPFLNRKLNESHLRLLTALLQFHELFNQTNSDYLKRNRY